MAKSLRKNFLKQLDALAKIEAFRIYKPITGGYCLASMFGLCSELANQPFHFITRSKQRIRWDPRNIGISCGGCNVKYEHDQGFIDAVITWYKRRFGQETWEQLVRDSHNVANFSMADLREIGTAIRGRLAVVPVTIHRATFGTKA